MFERQTEGSVVCPSCGRLVGVQDDACYNCGRRNPGMWGFAKMFQALGNDLGFVHFVFYGSILMYLLTIIYGGGPSGGLLSPRGESVFVFGASGAYPVFVLNRWWTVLSASFLHGGLLHIFFNLYWARILLPPVTDLFGAGRTVIIYTISSITGFFLSSWMGLILPGVPLIGGAIMTLGASAAIFGMLGALVRSGSPLGQMAKTYALVMGAFGVVSTLVAGFGVDNWAHLGGFIGGYLSAAVLDASKRETPAHVFAALGCIAAFVLSILASFLTA